MGLEIIYICWSRGFGIWLFPGAIPAAGRSGVPDLGHNSNSVLHFAKSIPDRKKCKLNFDNWFTSVKLVKYLATRKFLACGTVQECCLPWIPLKDDKQLKKLGRGSIRQCLSNFGDSTLTAIKWYNRSVCLLSILLTSHPTAV